MRYNEYDIETVYVVAVSYYTAKYVLQRATRLMDRRSINYMNGEITVCVDDTLTLMVPISADQLNSGIVHGTHILSTMCVIVHDYDDPKSELRRDPLAKIRAVSNNAHKFGAIITQGVFDEWMSPHRPKTERYQSFHADVYRDKDYNVPVGAQRPLPPLPRAVALPPAAALPPPGLPPIMSAALPSLGGLCAPLPLPTASLPPPAAIPPLPVVASTPLPLPATALPPPIKA